MPHPRHHGCSWAPCGYIQLILSYCDRTPALPWGAVSDRRGHHVRVTTPIQPPAPGFLRLCLEPPCVPGTFPCAGPFPRGRLVISQGPDRRALPAAKRVSLSMWEQGKRSSFQSLLGPLRAGQGHSIIVCLGFHQPILPTPLLVMQGLGGCGKGHTGSASESSWEIQLFLADYSHKKNKNKIGAMQIPSVVF